MLDFWKKSNGQIGDFGKSNGQKSNGQIRGQNLTSHLSKLSASVKILILASSRSLHRDCPRKKYIYLHFLQFFRACGGLILDYSLFVVGWFTFTSFQASKLSNIDRYSSFIEALTHFCLYFASAQEKIISPPLWIPAGCMHESTLTIDFESRIYLEIENHCDAFLEVSCL